MKKLYVNLVFIALILLSACVSKRKYGELSLSMNAVESSLKKKSDELISCMNERNQLDKRMTILQSSNNDLRGQINVLNQTNAALINNVEDLATLSTKGAYNLEKSLESMKEKDLQINYLRDAVTKRDSVTLALVTSIKGVLGDFQDDDIEVNVEKGVVYVAISDKLFFF